MSRKTKVTDLTQGVKAERKPIEFVRHLDTDGMLTISCSSPNQWDNLQRIARGKYDTIIAWDDDTNNRAIYLGHWNDGYVDND